MFPCSALIGSCVNFLIGGVVVATLSPCQRVASGSTVSLAMVLLVQVVFTVTLARLPAIVNRFSGDVNSLRSGVRCLCHVRCVSGRSRRGHASDALS